MENQNHQDQLDELLALKCIYDDNSIPDDGEIDPFQFNTSFKIKVHTSHTSPLSIIIFFSFPSDYPSDAPPKVDIQLEPLGMYSIKDMNIMQMAFQEIWLESHACCIFDTIQWVLSNIKSLILVRKPDLCIEQTPEVDQKEEDPVKVFCIFSGDPIVERKSKFIAHISTVRSTKEVELVVHQLKQKKKIDQATHNIVAYRLSSNGDNNVDIEDRDDDGESGAGDGALYVLRKLDVWNIVVIVFKYI